MENVGTGLIFAFVCVLFASAGAFLFLKVLESSLDFRAAAIIFAPLLACWLGIFLTLNGPLRPVAWALLLLAVAWCVMVPARTNAMLNRMNRDWSDAKIQELREWLQKQPADLPTHFRLAELLEDRGWLREAYQGYCNVLALDANNKPARLRSSELYRRITGQPLPLEQQARPDLPASAGVESQPGPPQAVPPQSGSPNAVPRSVDSKTDAADWLWTVNPTTRRLQVPLVDPLTAGPGGVLDSQGTQTTAAAWMVPEATFTLRAGPQLLGGEPDPDQSAPLAGELTAGNEAAGDRILQLRAIIARAPNNASLYAELGAALAAQKQTTEACDCYRRALALDPANERYREEISVLQQAGNS